jgi:hypothetical protein
VIDPSADQIGGIAGGLTALLVVGNILWRMVSRSRVDGQRDGAQIDVIKMQREQIMLLKEQQKILQEENRILRERLLISEARVAALRAGRPEDMGDPR